MPAVNSGAAVAGQLNGHSLGAEQRLQAGDEALGAGGRRAVHVDPSGEAVGTNQIVGTVEVKIIRRDAFERRGRRVRLRARNLLERGAVFLASGAHGAAIGDVCADTGPED